MSLSPVTKRFLCRRKLMRRAWETCAKGSILLRWAGDVEIPRPALVLATSACARQALEFVPASEPRPRIAIETAEAWARGEATSDEVIGAAADAYLVFMSSAGYAASAAAYAAHLSAQVVNNARSASTSITWICDAFMNTPGNKELECALAVRAAIAWPIVALAHEKAGHSIGETWLETIAAYCGVKPSVERKLSPHARHEISKIAREMAAKGRWVSKPDDPLEPLWKSIESARSTHAAQS